MNMQLEKLMTIIGEENLITTTEEKRQHVTGVLQNGGFSAKLNISSSIKV